MDWKRNAHFALVFPLEPWILYIFIFTEMQKVLKILPKNWNESWAQIGYNLWKKNRDKKSPDTLLSKTEQQKQHNVITYYKLKK